MCEILQFFFAYQNLRLTEYFYSKRVSLNVSRK